eukprot:1541969-Rhodomonas_salina.1
MMVQVREPRRVSGGDRDTDSVHVRVRASDSDSEATQLPRQVGQSDSRRHTTSSSKAGSARPLVNARRICSRVQKLDRDPWTGIPSSARQHDASSSSRAKMRISPRPPRRARERRWGLTATVTDDQGKPEPA